MTRLAVIDTPLAGLKVVQRQPIADARGFLARLFCADALREAGWRKPVAQINHTLTTREAAVRGLHFQHPPHAEMKLVSCVRGEVFDVAVDMRAGSPTFLHWFAERLSPGNGRALLIPEGFAHGFQTLTPDCELLYLHSSPHAPGSEGGLNAQDPRIGIEWPRAIAERSQRDSDQPLLSADFQGIPV